jgi:hypothetical protein
MNQGPDVVLACPHCQTLARLFKVESADDSGCTSWTDGYQEMPMTPAQPNVSRCRGCGKLMWVSQCVPAGMIDEDEPPEPGRAGWHELPYLEPVDEAGYLEALETGMAGHLGQETELRVFAWWRGNDQYRRSEGPGRHPKSPEAIANLEKLLELLREGEHEFVLFRAEGLRQLGRFDDSREALHGLCSDYASARDRIALLLDARSRDVEVLFPQPIPAFP